jgi:hypothetical protein
MRLQYMPRNRVYGIITSGEWRGGGIVFKKHDLHYFEHLHTFNKVQKQYMPFFIANSLSTTDLHFCSLGVEIKRFQRNILPPFFELNDYVQVDNEVTRVMTQLCYAQLAQAGLSSHPCNPPV